MSLTKITLAGLLVVGLCLPAAAQTRSAIIYPEDGNNRPADQSAASAERPVRTPSNAHRNYAADSAPATRPNSSYRTAQRLGDYSIAPLPDAASHRLRKASYTGPYGERVSGAQPSDPSPIPQKISGESAEVVNDPSAMQYEPLAAGGPLAESASCDGGQCDGDECGGRWGPRPGPVRPRHSGRGPRTTSARGRSAASGACRRGRG